MEAAPEIPAADATVLTATDVAQKKSSTEASTSSSEHAVALEREGSEVHSGEGEAPVVDALARTKASDDNMFILPSEINGAVSESEEARGEARQPALCGTFGCTRPNNHAGLHSFPDEVEPRRRSRPAAFDADYDETEPKPKRSRESPKAKSPTVACP